MYTYEYPLVKIIASDYYDIRIMQIYIVLNDRLSVLDFMQFIKLSYMKISEISIFIVE